MSAVSDEDELLAAELAFGLVDGAERRAAETRLEADPGFAAAHACWQTRAAAMADPGEELPPPSLWQRIVVRLPANDDLPVRREARRWQIATVAALLAAVVLAVTAIDRPVPVPVVQRPATPPLVALLTGTATGAVITVSFDAASGRLTLAPVALDPATRAAELWVIPVGGKPRSLGVIDPAAASWRGVPATASRVIAPGATLAITLEPAGGSPSGAPTGAVILSGIVKRV